MQLKSQLYTRLKIKLFDEFVTKVGKLHQQNFIYTVTYEIGRDSVVYSNQNPNTHKLQ